MRPPEPAGVFARPVMPATSPGAHPVNPAGNLAGNPQVVRSPANSDPAARGDLMTTTTAAASDRLTEPDTGPAASGWSASAVALWAGYTASLVLAVATLTRSFTATADFAVRVGAASPGWDAYLVPISVDVGILAGSIMAWASTRHGAGERNRWAYGLFAFAATTSVLLNIAHAPLPSTAPEGLDPLASAEHLRTASAAAADTGSRIAAKFIAGLPPLLLLWITEVLLRHASATTATASAHSRPDTAVAAGPDMPAATIARPDIAAVTVARPDTSADNERPADTPRPAPPPPPAAPAERSDTEVDPVAELVQAHLVAGGELGDAVLTAAVATTLGVTDRTARRRLQPYRDPDPAPLALVAGNGGPSR